MNYDIEVHMRNYFQVIHLQKHQELLAFQIFYRLIFQIAHRVKDMVFVQLLHSLFRGTDGQRTPFAIPIADIIAHDRFAWKLNTHNVGSPFEHHFGCVELAEKKLWINTHKKYCRNQNYIYTGKEILNFNRLLLYILEKNPFFHENLWKNQTYKTWWKKITRSKTLEPLLRATRDNWQLYWLDSFRRHFRQI